MEAKEMVSQLGPNKGLLYTGFLMPVSLSFLPASVFFFSLAYPEDVPLKHWAVSKL
jgi:hypothetical protein